MTRAVLLLALFSLIGCAREPAPAWPQGYGYASYSAWNSDSAPPPPRRSQMVVPRSDAVPVPWTRHHPFGSDLGGGQPCLDWLASYGVPYEALPPTRGMETPISVTGPIRGVRYANGTVKSIHNPDHE